MVDQLHDKLLLGLLGANIQASRSPAMYEREAEAQGILCLYQLIDLELLGLGVDSIPELLAAAERMGFAGVNVTHPCKQAVIPHLTEISDDASKLGAVNTVVLRQGKRIGHNTDWLGFRDSFKRGLPGVSTDRVVQLGAGGAGAATAYALLMLGAGCLTLVDPDQKKSHALMERMNAIFGQGRVRCSPELEACLRNADGIVHATPTGMFGHPGTAVPAQLLRNSLWVAEIVYFPRDTELLKLARAAGCRTVDGAWMAVSQAAEAFQRFFDRPPDLERMSRYFEECVEDDSALQPSL